MSFQRGLLFAVSAVFSGSAAAGGLLLYEVGTADVGLASAGYTARAQDASTVLTNPAGMTRLPGKQLLLGGTGSLWGHQFLRRSRHLAGTGPGRWRQSHWLVSRRRHVLHPTAVSHRNRGVRRHR